MELTNGQKEYLKYLNSDHWKELRKAAFLVYGKSCARCGSKEFLEVHHHTYCDDWYQCSVKDVEILCDFHHREEHGIYLPTYIEPKTKKLTKINKRLKKEIAEREILNKYFRQITNKERANERNSYLKNDLKHGNTQWIIFPK